MSAILSADDLNDFISPGVACIKPVETLPASEFTVESEYEVSFNTDIQPTPNLPPAQISLTDCLACSGCVTSAEAVLVSMQSHAEVLQELDSAPALRLRKTLNGSGLEIENLDIGGRIYVASISPQSRASIAATYGVTAREAGYMIEHLLSGPRGIKSRAIYRNGFHWVLDTNVAREACLVIGADEVLGPLVNQEEAVKYTDGEATSSNPKKPILTSSCPGWICYAEKTHPHILPHLSRLKSPQALLGTLIKTTVSRILGVPPDRIWHVAVMPCFDKKLEASREELTSAAWDETNSEGVRDVDCVITSKELLMLADSRRVDFASLPRTPLPLRFRVPFPDPKLESFLFPPPRRRDRNGHPSAGSSGGNLYYILQCLASRHPGSIVLTARGRNSDVVEYTVESPTDGTLLKAARYYGFRNIQNLVRRLKPMKPSRMPGGKPFGSARKPGVKAAGPDYAYIEVMACPGGCTNGGGQIKVDDPVVGHNADEAKPGPQEQKEWLARVDEAYFSADDSAEEEAVLKAGGDVIEGVSPSYIKDILAHWSNITRIDLDRLVSTSYREVISDVGKKTGDNERVMEIAGKIGGGW